MTVKHGFAFQGEYFHDQPTGLVLVTPGSFEIGGGFKSDKPKFYEGPVPEGFLLEAGDLIVTMTDLSKGGDTLGFPAIVPRSPGVRYLHNQRIGRVEVVSPKDLDKDYLYYLLCSDPYRHEVLAGATGSTVRHTSPSRIGAFIFESPPLADQQAVAYVLRTLDEKIDLNRRTNVTLDEMARALFKSWFVDFDPVRAKADGRVPASMDAAVASHFPDRFEESEAGEIPLGWRVASIYDLATVTYGAPFASAHFNGDGVGLPLLRIRDLATHLPEVCTPERHRAGTQVAPGDIVVGMDGEFRVHSWRGPVSWLNQRVCMFGPRDGVSRTYLRLSLEKPLAFFERAKVGTTVIHLGKADIDTFRVLVPPAQILDLFAKLTDDLAALSLCHSNESRTLATTRNALLPKLLSGELGVSDAEKAVEQIA